MKWSDFRDFMSSKIAKMKTLCLRRSETLFTAFGGVKIESSHYVAIISN